MKFKLNRFNSQPRAIKVKSNKIKIKIKIKSKIDSNHQIKSNQGDPGRPQCRILYSYTELSCGHAGPQQTIGHAMTRRSAWFCG